jgi:hypothetical protein
VLVSEQSRAVPMPNLCPTSAASDTRFHQGMALTASREECRMGTLTVRREGIIGEDKRRSWGIFFLFGCLWHNCTATARARFVLDRPLIRP